MIALLIADYFRRKKPHRINLTKNRLDLQQLNFKPTTSLVLYSKKGLAQTSFNGICYFFILTVIILIIKFYFLITQ